MWYLFLYVFISFRRQSLVYEQESMSEGNESVSRMLSKSTVARQ